MIRRRPRPNSQPRPAAEPLEGRAYFAGLTFGKVTSFAAGQTPSTLATADMNGDGLADIVVANYGVNASGGVSVLMGHGDGTFSAPVSYPINSPMQALAVADLNGDGRPDVLAAGYNSDNIYVWMNNGDGTLAAPVAYAVGSRPEGVALGDVNGDGRLDLVTANQGVVGKGSVSVLLGNGDGTFQPAVGYDGGSNPDALAVGDLNQDGLADIVTVDPENAQIHVLLNHGVATPNDLFPEVTNSYFTDTTGRDVLIVDTNNDARPDLAVANLRSASVGVYLNQGDGTFQDQRTYRVGGFPFFVASGDLNGDNRDELITADNRDNAVGVLIHNPSGQFNVGGGIGQTRDNTDIPRQIPTGTAPQAVVAVDVNGDGKLDLVTADFNDNAIGVVLNKTVFRPLITTTLTLATNQNPVQLGNPLTLTATVSPAPSAAFTGGRVVQFLAGTKVLGVAKLQADGTATVTTTKLALGTTSVVARYSGNAHYGGSAAAADIVVIGASGASPLLTATGVAITGTVGRAGRGSPATTATAAAAVVAPAATTTAGPSITPTSVTLTSKNGQPTSPFLPGDAGSLNLAVTNAGDARGTGSVIVALSIAPFGDTTSPGVAMTVTSASRFAFDLEPGGSFTVPVNFRVPAGLTNGNYEIRATLTTGGAFPASAVSTAVATTTTAAPVQLVLVPFVPGDFGSAAVTIANDGAGRAVGSVVLSLSIAPTDDLTAAVPVAIVGANTVALNLRGGASQSVPVRFRLPESMVAGNYVVLATLAAASNLSPDEVSAAPATSAQATTVVAAFGRVPSGQTHRTLSTTLPDGTAVTLSIAGPGGGTLVSTPVLNADGTATTRTDLSLAHTSAATTVTITTDAGGPAALTSITDNYRLGSLLAPNITLAGNLDAGIIGTLTLSTGASQVTLAGVAYSGLTFGPRAHTVASLGTVTASTLTAFTYLDSLSVNSWTRPTDAGGNVPPDLIVAPGIRGALTVAGDFDAAMQLSSAGLATTIGSASIGGTLSSAYWLAGRGIGALSVGSDLTNAEIIAGATAVAIRQGKTVVTTYRFNAAPIASVTIGGNVIGSLVAAGFRPSDVTAPPFPFADGTVLPGGSIGAITVAGTVDSASRFAAASVPPIG